MNRVLHVLTRLDRRWIFLLMAVSVLIPVLAQWQFPEVPTTPVIRVFEAIEALPPGSRVLVSLDFGPDAAPELEPMALSLMWHCARKGHRQYLMTTWATGENLVQAYMNRALRPEEWPDYRYGRDYVYLGYRAGNEVVIKTITTNLRAQFLADHFNTNLNDLPVTRDVVSIRDMDLILSISAGTPGSKEWIQYAATPCNIPIATGNTGIQTTTVYPYYPNQMIGILGAIKGAAEYEALLIRRYPDYAVKDGQPRREFTRAIQRMGPQLIAHCLVMSLIVLGNLVLLWQRRAGGPR